MKMKALILAGGLGTRLRPLTYNIPKVMLEINGKPFLYYLIKFLAKQNIKDIVISVGYLKESIIEYFKNGSNFNVNIEYSVENEPLGTAGAIRNAKRFLEGKFIVMNGDTFFDINVGNLLKFHERKKGICTIALASVDNTERYGSVEIDKDNKIIKFFEKGTKGKGLINGGVYIFEEEIFNHLPQIGSIEKDVFPLLIGKMYGYIHSGYFIDIGTPEEYNYIKSKGFEFILKWIK